METVTIRQPAGIGDIFYCLKIACLLLQKGNKVVWPVIKEFSYIGDYIKYPNLSFPIHPNPADGNAEIYNVKPIIPLQHADYLIPELREDVMKAKYELVKQDSADWLDYFCFFRNYEREGQLYRHLNPMNEKYILRSNNVGSPPDFIKKDIRLDHIDENKAGSPRIIDIDVIEGYNIFDWCTLLEKASEIHMVDTAFMYIMEKLDLKGSVFKLYSRFNPANFNVVKHIPQNVKWEYMEW